jgi:probable addiction module antidote protein
MTTADQIYEQARLLPDPLAREALDFVLFLRERQERGARRDLTTGQSAAVAVVSDNKEDDVWNEPLTTYDPAEDLTSDAAIATFMAEAFASEDAGYIAHALGVVARAKGMAQIASQTGLSREQLYRSFSENGNPTLKTTIAVMKALGIELTAKVHA